MMHLQDCLMRNGYNLALGVQEYNQGYVAIQAALDAAQDELHIDRATLESYDNLDWLKYRDVSGTGDPYYLEHVFQYVQDGTPITLTKPDGSKITFMYDNLNFQEFIKR